MGDQLLQVGDPPALASHSLKQLYDGRFDSSRALVLKLSWKRTVHLQFLRAQFRSYGLKEVFWNNDSTFFCRKIRGIYQRHSLERFCAACFELGAVFQTVDEVLLGGNMSLGHSVLRTRPVVMVGIGVDM